MRETTIQRWRGLNALLRDGVDQGSRAIETLQLEVMRRPCQLLERIPPLTVPVKSVRTVHDAVVSGVHGTLRLVNQTVGETVDTALKAALPHNSSKDS